MTMRVDGDVVVVAGENGLGDNGSGVDMGSEGLVVGDQGLVLDDGVGNQRSGMNQRSRVDDGGVGLNRVGHRLGDNGDVVAGTVAHHVRGVDVAESVVEDQAGQTAGSGAGHGQHGGEQSL